ncbi:MAG: hypothetical protein IAE79_12945 [Anaerolinea sp.]|nr:hypothetical protein [Anaerolinea sp.]
MAGVGKSGTLLFADHAQYCSICIDITHDTMRLLDEGKSTAEIFARLKWIMLALVRRQ